MNTKKLYDHLATAFGVVAALFQGSGLDWRLLLALDHDQVYKLGGCIFVALLGWITNKAPKAGAAVVLIAALAALSTPGYAQPPCVLAVSGGRIVCAAASMLPAGPQGPAGAQGAPGVPGPQGPAGAIPKIGKPCVSQTDTAEFQILFADGTCGTLVYVDRSGIVASAQPMPGVWTSPDGQFKGAIAMVRIASGLLPLL